LKYLKHVDFSTDTLKYFLLLELLVEAAAENKITNEFTIGVINEAKTFFENFQKEFFRPDLKDHAHNIIYNYAQIFVDHGVHVGHGIRTLMVFL